MKRYIISRLAIILISLLGLITLSFAMVSILPGDPARVMLGEFASPQSIAKVHHQLGLDKPFLQRYVDYVDNTVHGDLGTSYFTGISVTKGILLRLPNTLVVLLPGLALALVLGLFVGSASAYFRGRLPDRLGAAFITTAQAVPEFVVGLLLLYVCFATLHIAPAPVGMLNATDVVPRSVTGSTSLDAVLTGSWSAVQTIAAHAVLPILTLSIFLATYFAKATRIGLTQSLASSQVEFARACGLRERTVFSYAMSSIRTSLLTYLVILFGAALGGAAIIENVFSWPGVGGWSLQGVIQGDVPVIQGFVLVMGASTLLMYVLLDVAIMVLDPRTRRR
jgi:ABC-type dipeptide/oligopeptide/nickel transport system permease component